MNPNAVKKPNVSEDLAIDLAFRLYGFAITSIKGMVSYDDQNYHIQVSEKHQNPYITSISKEGYTLKITNTAKSSVPGHFDSMHSTMVHLHNKGIRVPIPVPNIDGNTWKLEKVPLINEGIESSDDLCGIHLLTFISGQPVSSVAYSKSLLYQWGCLASKMHNAVEDLMVPSLVDKSIFWNLEHIPEIRLFMDGLEEDKLRLVTSILDEYPQQIEKNLPNLRKGFIHGDFNDNNILCRISDRSLTNEPECIVDGLLDFEDIHYGTYVWDIGVMLAYSLIECETMDPLEGAGHVLAGYLKHRSLDSLELSLLKMCTACRLCQSLVLGAHSYRLNPSNSYIMVTARTGWERLKQIWNTKNEDLLAMWKNIQKQYENS